MDKRKLEELIRLVEDSDIHKLEISGPFRSVKITKSKGRPAPEHAPPPERVVAAPAAPIVLNIVFAVGSMAVSFAVYTVYAVLFSLPAMRDGYRRVTCYVEVVFGSLFCLFGLRLLTTP